MAGFKGWLKNAKMSNDPEGDLIYDLKDDSRLPRRIASKEQLASYMRTRRACPEALEALDEVWRRFEAETSAD